VSLEDYRAVFIGVSFILILLVASPILSLVLPFSSGSEHFSEFWVLGPTHMAEAYPSNVRVNETYKLFVGITNHLGSSAYYVVYLKFRNQSQPLPNVATSEASPLEPFYTYMAFIVDGGTWESPLTFGVLKSSSYDNFVSVDSVSINDVVFPVNVFSAWDAAKNGFYYELFFELWLYNTSSHSFQFHNRFLGIWLNMTN